MSAASPADEELDASVPVPPVHGCRCEETLFTGARRLRAHATALHQRRQLRLVWPRRPQKRHRPRETAAWRVAAPAGAGLARLCALERLINNHTDLND